MVGVQDSRNIQEQQQTTQMKVQYQPLVHGHDTCNIDACFYKEEGATGLHWCINDYRRQFILAGSNTFHERFNTTEGEALSIKEAMYEVIQRSLSHVNFKSDSKFVVDDISSRCVGYSEFSMLRIFSLC
jgi:ribonuclease HI